jgi:hypothetical protein
MARELAIRGKARGFNGESIELVESIADTIPEVRDIGQSGTGTL